MAWAVVVMAPGGLEESALDGVGCFVVVSGESVGEVVDCGLRPEAQGEVEVDVEVDGG